MAAFLSNSNQHKLTVNVGTTMSMRDHNIKATLSNQNKNDIFQSLPLLPEHVLNVKTVSTAGLIHSPFKEDRLKTDQWAFTIRQRIQTFLNQKENIPRELLCLLKNELIQVFIEALQEDSRQLWTFLHDVLQLLVPFKDDLEVSDWDHELHHYMKRIWRHLSYVRDKQLDVDILGTLKQIFPKAVLQVEKEADSNFLKTFPKSANFPRNQVSNTSPRPSILKNNMDIFSTKFTLDEKMSTFPKPLTVLDLHRSIGNVAYDIAAYESFWGSCRGLTAQAVNVSLPEEVLESKAKVEEKKIIEELPPKKSKSPKKVEEPLLILSGREAVEHYIKCQYLHKVEHLYFNIAPSRHYRPYHLVSVPKDKVNREYYLFSSFGVLRVDSDSQSETFRLSEWQRQAVLWEAIHEIPFFRNYLISKMFYRWKAAKGHLVFLKTKDTLEKSLLQSMPIYEVGLLQVLKLLNELMTIDFFPFQADKSYTLPEFEDAVFQLQSDSKVYLERFFRLCKIIVDVIMFESFKKLRFCEEQMTTKNMFSRDSLFRMKMKKKQRTANFLRAKNETSHLGNFVLLINKMTVEYLFSIAKSHIHKFIHEVLRSKYKDEKNGFFCIKLIFNEQDQLEFSPPFKKCQEFLQGTLNGISSVLCSKAIPFGILEISKKKSDVVHPDIYDSSEAIKRYIKQFLNANPHLVRDSPDIVKNLPFVNKSQEILEDNLFEEVDLDKLQKTMPTKHEDDWGVATPDNICQSDKKVTISGEGFLGQYTPLFTSKLEEKLLDDPQYMKSVQFQDHMLSNAKKNLQQYIDSLKWLEPIYKTCKEWTSESLYTFKELPPPDIEQKLGELNTWSKEVKKMDVSFITKNKLIWLDCREVRDYLIPHLDDIYKELLEYVLNECKNNSIYFCKQIDQMSKILDGKPDEVKTFAEYVKLFKKSKEDIPGYKHLVDYTKSIYEITRSYHRLLTDEEFEYENNLWVQWEILQVMMQNVSEFVITQSPIMERRLEEMFKKLEIQASDYCEEATSGKFLDPNQNPSRIVDQIRQIRQKFYAIQQKLINYSKWKKDICGESFDLSFLHEMVFKMDSRSDLWKYLLNTIQSIDSWKMMPFKKMKFVNAVKKINEWKTVAANLKSVLPPGDLVLEYWEQCLNNFLEPLPLLQIISSDRHKSRHWKAIFNGMSAVYITTKKYLVQELLSLDLTKHKDMIMAVHQLAIAEYDLEQRVKKMKKVWEDKMFKLLKYIPDSSKSHKGRRGAIPIRKISVQFFKNIISVDDEYYILIEMERLKSELMDDSIILATMLSSSFLGDMKVQVENLASALYQVEEIINLWVSAQKKWMFLVKIFEKPTMVDKFPQFASKFEVSVHSKFKEWMRVVYADSKVLSVATKSISEKGYRFLQGEQLRKMFLSVIESMDNIIENLRFYLDERRMMFPRLFFLSDNELVEVLSISDDPHELPGVSRCFPGIDSITLTVLGTNLMSSKLAASELAMNAHRLITIGIEGKHGEQLRLIRSVGPMKGVIQWLHDLEASMKDTIVDNLARCIEEKFKNAGIIQPSNINNEESGMTFSQWIKEFPVECLRLAEAITWEKQMAKCLENKNRPAMKKMKSDIQKQIFTLTQLPRKHSVSASLNMEDQKYYIHNSLIVLWINLRDLTQVLLKDESASLHSFEWQTALKYNVNYKAILRAETEQEMLPNLDPVNSGVPNMTRTKTTVKTLYKMTNCIIHQMAVRIPYEYEYLGPSSVFLNTPLTEKAMLSLTHSLKNYQCGTIVGPSSVGKTETIKEFSRAFGQCLFHIKCGELVSSFQIKQYLIGLITSGCWALFDDVNRLTKDVMCTLSQYLDQIQTALRGLQSTQNSQYGLRGQSKMDKKPSPSQSGTLIRRNSLTTLHSLEKEPTSEDIMAPLNRQRTVPHGYNDKGLVTFFEDEWVSEKTQRRSSIYETGTTSDSEFFPNKKPPPIAYEKVKRLNMKTDIDFNQMQNKTLYNRIYIGNIKFDGQFLQSFASYGCFMTLNTTEASHQDIPENFRLLLRPFSLLTPDYQRIAQIHCFMYGFEQHELLANKLVMFIKLFQTWLPQKVKFQVKNLSFLISVLTALKKNKTEIYRLEEFTLKKQDEKQFMIEAIKEVFIPYLDEGRDKMQFWNLLQDVFGYVPQVNSNEDPFHKALQDQLKENQLKLNPVMISKMVELYKSCSLSLRSIIVCGPCGSGKTLILKTLIQTLNMLSYKAAAIEKPDEEIRQRQQESEVIISKANQKIKARMQLLQHIISNVRPPPSTLNKAILKKKIDSSHYPRIYTSHLFPSAMSPEEFLGYYTSNGWQSGALWRELHKSTFSDAISTDCDQGKPEPVADTQVWLIFDGTLHSSWCDPISSLFDSSRKLILPNADTFIINDETKLIIETDQLNDATPAMLNQCSVVFCSPTSFQWESLFNNWKEKITFKCYMTDVGIKLLDELANQMIPATLNFLRNGGVTPALVADLSPLDYQQTVVGVQEVTAFLTLLSILLDKNLTKDSSDLKSENSRTEGSISSEKVSLLNYRPDEDIPFYMDIIKGTFVFCFIWGFGSHLHERNKYQYSDHIRQNLYKMRNPIHFPSDGTVFDYWIDESNGAFYPWTQKLTGSYKCQTSYVFISEFERYDYILKLLLDYNIPVLITGDPGVGKTSFIKNAMLNTKTRRHCMSALQTPNRFLEIIMLRQQWSGVGVGKTGGITTSAAAAAKRGKTLPSTKKKKVRQSHVIFIDDLNMAPKENGCQPTLELFRQVLTLGTVFDKQQHTECSVKHLNYLASTTLPSAPRAGLGRSCHILSSRLSRLFFNITFHTPTYDQLKAIYSCTTFTWLDDLPPFLVQHPSEMAKAMTQGTLDLYLQIKERFNASPASPLYIFTLHDLANVFDGIKLFTSRSAAQKITEYKNSIDLSSSSTSASSFYEISYQFTTNNNSRQLPLAGLLVRLWANECNRTFADRIIDKQDYDWYLQCIENLTKKYFCQPRAEQPPLTSALDMTIITEEISQIDNTTRSSTSESTSATEIGPIVDTIFTEEGPSEYSASQDRRNSEITSDNHTYTETQAESEEATETSREQDTDQQSSEFSAKTSNTSQNQSREAESQSEESKSHQSRTPTAEPKKILSSSPASPHSTRRLPRKSFHGALMNMEDIKGELKSLGEIMFSRYILYADSTEKGYTECSMSQMIDALKKRITRYSSVSQVKWNLSLINEFIPIITKMTRILTFPQGHGLLFRSSYRPAALRALVRLAAYLAKAELIEPSIENGDGEGEDYDRLLGQSLKSACHQAGVLATPTILMIPEIFAYNCDLTSISNLLAEGDCPYLYEEALQLSHLVQTALSEKKISGSANKLTDEQMAKVFQIFFNRIKQNLHVFILLTLSDSDSGENKSNEVLENYPNLIKHSCSVTIQQPLSTIAYQQLTLSWIKEEDIECLFNDIMEYGQPFLDESIILATVSAAMAYVHQTAQTALMRQVIQERNIVPCYTVNHLRELVHMFKKIVMFIIQREKESISHYAGALGKVNEAYGSINDYKETICRLSPQHKTAVDNIQDNIYSLSQKREAYKKLLSLNKKQEAKIVKLQKLKEKMIDTQSKMFLQVEPQYRQALQSLNSIDKVSWYEVKKYRQPPEPIKKLLGAICLLFGRPISWEEGMSLMSDVNFMNNITYYNKKELSDDMYYALQRYIVDSDLKPQTMGIYSRAASSICQWVFSVYHYATIVRRDQPLKQKLQELEKKLLKSHETLGKLRKETKFCKNALDKNLKKCKESMKNAKALEKQIQNFEKKVADASHLMGNISGQHKLWKKEVTHAKQNIITALGDGLLAAAYVCYCGPLDDQIREKLLDDWLEHFEQEMFIDVTASKLYPKMFTRSSKLKSTSDTGETQDFDFGVIVQAYETKVHRTEFNYSSGLMTEADAESLDDTMDYDSDNEDEAGKVLMVRKNFQLLKVLSSYEELSEWRMKNYPVDTRSLQNACLINMCKWNFRNLWPLLVDPDGQAELWVRNLYLLYQEKTKECEYDSFTHSTDVSPADYSNASSTVDLLLPNDPAQTTLSPSVLNRIHTRCIEWSMGDKMCVLQADDPLLESKISDAINYGLFLLVTQVGHQPLNPTLLWLLSCYKVEETTYGDTYTVLKSAKMTSPCHKDFHLFLSTNVPLNIHGFDFHHLPLEEMNIIDMSLSNEAVMNRILYETLQLERLDFEKQRRANETDIIQHRQQLFHEFALIREKTMNLEGPLIEDKTILESLLACQRNVERNRLILDESCSKERHLEETYAPYVSMVIEAATIYSSLKNINQLYPCYYVSFDTFIKLFMNGLHSRNREYGDSGEPKSRANELLNAATGSIFEFVSTMMFEEHLIIFYLGFTLERLLENKMATELEIGIFVNGFKIKNKNIDSLITGKPKWISEQVWTESFLLENMLEVFKGLRQSFLLPFVLKQWQEYFKRPIILMNQVPDEKLKNLTIFQKALLWKIFCPDRFSELCHSLIVSEIGSLVIPPDNYNIKNVYKLSQSDTPVLFLLPSSQSETERPDVTHGSLYADPVREVKRFAKELKMDGRVCVANCTSQLTAESLTDIVTECFNNGYWLILQNYHMCSTNIHLQLATILKIILWDESKRPSSSAISSKIHLSNSSSDLDEQTSKANHFRLWVTFDSQQSKNGLPPACLIQQSVKVTCETSRNFQSTLLKCHRAAKFLLHRYPFDHNQEQKLDECKSYEIMTLAALHGLLIQQQCFTFMQPQRRAAFNKLCHWSVIDMASVSDFFCHWLPINNMKTLEKLADLIGGIYASHCTDEYDAALVKAFALDVLKTMYLLQQKASAEAEDKNRKTAPETVAQPDTAASHSASSSSSSFRRHTLKGLDDPGSPSQLAPDLLSLLFCFTDTAKRSKADSSSNQISTKGLTYSLHQKAVSTNNGSFFSDVHYQVYGLPVMAQHSLLQHQSRILFNEISILGPHQHMFKQMYIKLADIFQSQLTDILEQVSEKLNSLPEFPDISKMVTLYPDENFLLHEISNNTQLFHLITEQVEVLKMHQTQQTGLTKEMLQVKKLISKNEIPTPWLSFSFPSNLKLTDWLKKTVTNTKQLLSLVNDFSAFQSHNITTFLRPDCLLSAIIQTYARKNFKELSNLRIEGMFQDEIDDPPTSRIILTNARLCNAKWHSGSLQLVENGTRTNSSDEECTCTEGLLYLKITDKSEKQTTQPFYLCPVFLSEDDLDLSDRNSVAEIPLPVSGDRLLFYGKKVHLHFSQEADDD